MIPFILFSAGLITLLFMAFLFTRVHLILKKTISTMEKAFFLLGAAIILKADIPNIRINYQLWTTGKLPADSNLALAKGLSLQLGLIFFSSILLVFFANGIARFLQMNKEEDSRIKGIAKGIILVTLAYFSTDYLFEIGKNLMKTSEAAGFN